MISFHGKTYPFTPEEFAKILKFIHKNLLRSEENIEREDEEKNLNTLLKNLNK